MLFFDNKPSEINTAGLRRFPARAPQDGKQQEQADKQRKLSGGESEFDVKGRVPDLAPTALRQLQEMKRCGQNLESLTPKPSGRGDGESRPMGFKMQEPALWHSRSKHQLPH